MNPVNVLVAGTMEIFRTVTISLKRIKEKKGEGDSSSII